MLTIVVKKVVTMILKEFVTEISKRVVTGKTQVVITGLPKKVLDTSNLSKRTYEAVTITRWNGKLDSRGRKYLIDRLFIMSPKSRMSSSV